MFLLCILYSSFKKGGCKNCTRQSQKVLWVVLSSFIEWMARAAIDVSFQLWLRLTLSPLHLASERINKMCHFPTVRKQFVHFLLKYGKLKTDSVFGLGSWFYSQSTFSIKQTDLCLECAFCLENSQLEAVNLNESNLCEQLKVQYTLYLQWKVPYVFIERCFFSSRVSFGRRQGSFSRPVVLCGKSSYIFSSVVFCYIQYREHKFSPKMVLLSNLR